MLLCAFFPSYTSSDPQTQDYDSAGLPNANRQTYYGTVAIGADRVAAALDRLLATPNCSVPASPSGAGDQVGGVVSVGMGGVQGPAPSDVPQDQLQGMAEPQGVWAFVGSMLATQSDLMNTVVAGGPSQREQEQQQGQQASGSSAFIDRGLDESDPPDM